MRRGKAYHRWQVLWHMLREHYGVTGSGETIFDELAKRYAEPHRCYHTMAHILYCLRKLDQWGYLLSGHMTPEEIKEHRKLPVALALFFHDAIYEIRNKDNEERSAELAKTRLSGAGIGDDLCECVAELVLATDHSKPFPDAFMNSSQRSLIHDIDLLILAEDERQFDIYERAISTEYVQQGGVVPALYWPARVRVLETLLVQERLFMNQTIHTLKGDTARYNLCRARERALQHAKRYGV